MIKGRATIQLFDEKTGKVIHEIHEENMITNAVDTILNPPDYIETGMDAENDRSFNMLRDFVGNIADTDRKSTRLNSSHRSLSRMPSSA